MSTIPASEIVNIVPGVISAGGNALSVIGLMLTESSRVPIGTVKSFNAPEEVQSYFGASSNEAAEAAVYFKGYTNATDFPGALLVAQYNSETVSAYLRSGPVGETVTLAQLQAMSGDISVNVDGAVRSATGLSLAGATSYSNAAGLIQTALNNTLPTIASVTASIAGTNFVVSAIASGVIAIGQAVEGTSVAAGTVITGFVSGTEGGVGTYTVNNTQTVSSESMTTSAAPVAVSYDSVSEAFIIASTAEGTASTIMAAAGGLATSLELTIATGAVISQGAAPASPSAFMDGVIDQTQNWVTFWTIFDPDNGSGNSVKLEFSQWTDLQNQRFAYVTEDTDLSPTTTVPATSSLGYLIAQADLSGTCLIFNNVEANYLAAFICGAAASLDFARTNGRTTFADLNQAGLIASVTSPSIAQNLAANGYNFYGAYATANSDFLIFRNGAVSGSFLWLDSYINQIWMNSAFQLALMTLLTSVGSIPYNPPGYALIESSLADPINAAGNFGAFRPNVTLSASQIAQVNQAAGVDIASTLQSRGWYLQVLDASPQVRQARGTPPITFWYVDGQSVQNITMNSVAVL